MKQAREGGWSVSIESGNSSPEIVSLIKSFHSLMESLHLLVKNIRSTTGNLHESGSLLQVSSENVNRTNDDLMEGMKIVKLAAEETATSAENSIFAFQNMKQDIYRVMERMETIFSRSEEMKESSESGTDNMKQLADSLGSFEFEFRNAIITINSLKTHSISVTSILSLIQPITEQSTRRGSRKGIFSIANEVRKYAVKSSNAAEQIGYTIAAKWGVSPINWLQNSEKLHSV
ncbi:hypothetical protein CUU64_04590 [Bacillus sp. V5-8f]|nr:hypothetical protein CUU64_04590 [Bacillus sp. V5-8f]